MNLNVLRYRLARNVLFDARDVAARLGDKPVCSLTLSAGQVLGQAEERVVEIPKMIDRLRFLAKHDRSKYMPHVGLLQQSKHDTRKVCCL